VPEDYGFDSFSSKLKTERENIKPVSQGGISKTKPETSFLG